MTTIAEPEVEIPKRNSRFSGVAELNARAYGLSQERISKNLKDEDPHSIASMLSSIMQKSVEKMRALFDCRLKNAESESDKLFRETRARHEQFRHEKRHSMVKSFVSTSKIARQRTEEIPNLDYPFIGRWNIGDVSIHDLLHEVLVKISERSAISSPELKRLYGYARSGEVRFEVTATGELKLVVDQSEPLKVQLKAEPVNDFWVVLGRLGSKFILTRKTLKDEEQQFMVEKAEFEKRGIRDLKIGDRIRIEADPLSGRPRFRIETTAELPSSPFFERHKDELKEYLGC